MSKKECYEGPRGFVHVFEHGARTCNCGEKKAPNEIPNLDPRTRSRKRRKRLEKEANK